MNATQNEVYDGYTDPIDNAMTNRGSDLMARLERRQAEIDANNGMAEFETIVRISDDVEPNFRFIDGKYGTCYAICDANGKFTGEFIGIGASDKALAKKGYKRALRMFPAEAKIVGNSFTNLMVLAVRK